MFTNLISLLKSKLFLNDIVYLDENITVSGLCNNFTKTLFISDVYRNRKKQGPILYIVNSYDDIKEVSNFFNMWSDINTFEYFEEDNNFNDDRVDRKIRFNKIKLIETLKSEEKVVVIARYRDLLTGFPSFKKYNNNISSFKVGDEIDFVGLFSDLIDKGYSVAKHDLELGEYIKRGDVLDIYVPQFSEPVRLEVEFDKIISISTFNKDTGEYLKKIKNIEFPSINLDLDYVDLLEFLNKKGLFVVDQLEVPDDLFDSFAQLENSSNDIKKIHISIFPENEDKHVHLGFLNILKYTDFLDFTTSLKDRIHDKWKIMIFTKNGDTIKGALRDKKISFEDKYKDIDLNKDNVVIFDLGKDDFYPEDFMNHHLKLLCVRDKDIHLSYETKKISESQDVFQDFLMSLKVGNYVVHENYGIAVFDGLDKRTINNHTNEYLKLSYAENDRLFVPIHQAYKVNKYVGAEDFVPKLTRLGSVEWATVNKRMKKDVEELAKELLELYAKRKLVKGHAYGLDTDNQSEFGQSFKYDLTPGQLKAVMDVKKDMESGQPMDRLICGDVGFGKTEVAMRAAFKSVQNNKQVALVSPITILTDQHYRSFKARMDKFHIRVEMLSRFRTAKEQKEIVKKLGDGEIDIIIGTHRLMQPDIKFKNLGLLIIDEEQRFGVKQKEKLKKLRAEIDILTLTATPIPRTLNLSLNKLRDISTITTPPPGRLPVITEVRRYSENIIREAIMRELSRKGQLYFLHNRVQTIDSVASKLKKLVPEARFIVAHGKLSSEELANRIFKFKNHEFDVLVSSTIIENGIDLSNANTLIVNNADNFGLSQLYQLRGRVGRSKTQAYAYFLYMGQHLKLDAKKRLRAIVEASKPGSGFQIAMHDLEIRGAGDILGANQSGTVNTVGVSHFMRMLNKTVEDMKSGAYKAAKDGGDDEVLDVSIDLPITAYIPDDYIVNAKEKIYLYQKLSGADNFKYLKELKDNTIEEYGKMPIEVINLFRVLELKLVARAAHLLNIKTQTQGGNNEKYIVLTLSKQVKPPHIMNLFAYNNKWQITGSKLILPIKELGLDWFEALKKNIDFLSKKIVD